MTVWHRDRKTIVLQVRSNPFRQSATDLAGRYAFRGLQQAGWTWYRNDNNSMQGQQQVIIMKRIRVWLLF